MRDPSRSALRQWARIMGATAALWLLLWAGGARAERQGEAFTFSLRLGPIEGGRARLAIAPPFQDPAGRSIHVIGEAEAVGLAKVLTKLEDRYRLVIDADTFLPRSMQVEESGYLRNRTVLARFSGRRTDLEVQGPGSALEKLGGLLPSAPMDPVAALLVMRAALLRDGDQLRMVIIDGGAFYQGQVQVVGRETIRLGDQARRAIRLRCTGERIFINGRKVNAPVRAAMLWLSDDPARVPLRMSGETDLGTAYVELTSYEPPRQPLPAPAHLPGVEVLPRPPG